MSIGLANSRIETFRKRYHGANFLRLYRLNEDGESLTIIRNIVKGFYLGTNQDTSEGAAAFLLTIDKIYTPALTENELGLMYMVDLINPTSNFLRRYRLNTETLPVTSEWRYICQLHAAYTDEKGVI